MEQGAAPSVTPILWEPPPNWMETLPVRAVGRELAVTVTVSTPLPVTELFAAPTALKLIHAGESVEKLQAQAPEFVEILMLFTPPFDVTLIAVGETV
jgi:hypothetical protein